MIGRYKNLSQILAARKRVRPHTSHAVGDGDTREGGAGIKRAIADGGYAVGDGDAREGGAGIKRAIADGDYAVRDGDACEGIAEIERAIADGGYGVRDGDAFERFTEKERAVADGGRAVGNRVTGLRKCAWIVNKLFLGLVKQYAVNGRKNGVIGRYDNLSQAFALKKWHIAKLSQAVREGDAFERFAGKERIIADGSGAVGNGIAGLRRRARVTNQLLLGLVKQYAVNDRKGGMIGRYDNLG